MGIFLDGVLVVMAGSGAFLSTEAFWRKVRKGAPDECWRRET